MIDLIVATHNKNKTHEFAHMSEGIFKIHDLHDIQLTVEIPETGTTLEENALLKARFVHSHYGYNCLSDDTGLEIDCLGGAPGVMSARFAGEEKNSTNNIRKVLDLMQNETNRKARFRTVIALIINNKEYFFEGICEGKITTERSGEKGFGYDPVFIPNGANTTFANMDIEEKNKYSHRKKATQQLIDFLNQYDGKN